MASSNLKVVLFLSSVRPNRLAERVGIHLMEAIRTKGMTPILIDPAKLPLSVVEVPIHFMQKPEDAPEWMKDVHEKIKTADAFLIATAEYNCVLPAALTNIMDSFPPVSYRNRPCGIVTYSPGSFGGVRAGTLLRVYISEFGMFPVPTSVIIPKIHDCISDEGIMSNERVSRNIEKVLNELFWFATAIKNHSAITPPPEYQEDHF